MQDFPSLPNASAHLESMWHNAWAACNNQNHEPAINIKLFIEQIENADPNAEDLFIDDTNKGWRPPIYSLKSNFFICFSFLGWLGRCGHSTLTNCGSNQNLQSHTTPLFKAQHQANGQSKWHIPFSGHQDTMAVVDKNQTSKSFIIMKKLMFYWFGLFLRLHYVQIAMVCLLNHQHE